MRRAGRRIASGRVAALVGLGALCTAAWAQPEVPAERVKPSIHGELLRDAQARDGTVRRPGAWIVDRDDVSLRAMGQIEFRYVLSARRDQPVEESEFTHGFENTRTRLGVKGHVIDRSVTYFIWGGWNAAGADFLLDAWVKKTWENGVFLQAGQFKAPTTREWLVSETRQQFVERSLVDARFGQVYSQGVQAGWLGEDVRVYGAVTDGLRSQNSSGVGQQLGLSGRAEIKLAGSWADYAEYASQPDDRPLVVFGVAGHTQDGGTSGDGATFGTGTANRYSNDTRIDQWTADVQLGFGGANLSAAVVGNHERRPASGTLGPVTLDQIGVVVQGGVFVSDTVELVARYAWGDLDGEGAESAGGAGDTLSVVMVGVNKFFAGHAAKLTVDLGVATEPVDASWGGAGRGWLPDAAGGDGQFVLRAQMNLLF